MKHYKTISLMIASAITLAGCSAAERLSEVGQEPALTKIENPTTKRDYKPISMPMPAPKAAAKNNNSLWAGDKKGFFKDQRASEVGDILTIIVSIDDQADIENETSRSRSSSEDAGLNSLLGYENALNRVLPESVDNTDLIDLGSESSHSGKGSVGREEEIELQLAAIITQKLPNGNLVVQGRQEVRVNFEKRILELVGVIRPEDISIDNTISHEKIAEARISYGGKGQITDMQQPRYGQQIYDIVFPF